MFLYEYSARCTGRLLNLFNLNKFLMHVVSKLSAVVHLKYINMGKKKYTNMQRKSVYVRRGVSE